MISSSYAPRVLAATGQARLGAAANDDRDAVPMSDAASVVRDAANEDDGCAGAFRASDVDVQKVSFGGADRK
jgi:hypothetical protein